jgi:DNA-binding response OmpR family regulator
MTDQKFSILLVDDDSFLLQMYGMKFTSEGFTVQTATSVSHALELLKQGLHFDAIAFDITMPEHDGFFLLDALKRERLGEGAKKIALTNQQSEAEKAKAIEMGADEYLIKATMIPSEVVNMVRTLISGAQAS